MKISEKGLNGIKIFEGCRLKAYQDSVGVWTVGYGSTGSHVYKGLAITQDRAENLLREDLERFEACVNRYVEVEMTQGMYDALCSFAFNLGCGALKKSTLLKRLNVNRKQDAADEMLRWDKAGGKRLAGLTRRRTEERELFLS